jgi:hypothetical protein
MPYREVNNASSIAARIHDFTVSEEFVLGTVCFVNTIPGERIAGIRGKFGCSVDYAVHA